MASVPNVAEMSYGSVFPSESIKVIAESIGVSSLSDDAAKELADDISARTKLIVQDALKFMHHCKRDRLTCSDIDKALRVRKIEPQYGFQAKDYVPFRFASGGGRELHFLEEREIDFSEVNQQPLPKTPLDINLRAHWLAIGGVQPLIPENPPPLSREAQLLESVNPALKLDQAMTRDVAGRPATGKLQKLRNVETVNVKQLATHELSVEQQLYYKEITEACVGSDEPRRGEALQSLSLDPGLHEMLPRMCTFIAEGVKVNVVQNNLALLIYLMRMVKAILDNPALYLEKYLHEIIPSVMTCIVSKQLCMRPELDNHWALRDFASRLMSQICKTFNSSTNNLQTRVTRIFSLALQTETKTHLSSLYGSIAGLCDLGVEVIKVFIIPRLKFISERIEGHLLGTAQSNTDKTAAGHIRAMIQKCCPPILKQIRSPPDLPEEYKNDFGFLGVSLCQAVIKARNSPNAPQIMASTSSLNSTLPITSAAQTATGSVIGRTLATSRQGPVMPPLAQIRAVSQGAAVKASAAVVAAAAAAATVSGSEQSPPHKFVIVSSSGALGGSSSPPPPTSSVVVQSQSQQRPGTPQTLVLTSVPSPQNSGGSNNNSNNGIGNVTDSNLARAAATATGSNVTTMSASARPMTSGGVLHINPGFSTSSAVIRSSDSDVNALHHIHETTTVEEDPSSIIIETEEVRPPPELDDLSHLE